MRAKQLNDQVFVADEPIVRVGAATIAELKAVAASNDRRRARLCVHRSNEDPLHEMLIVLDRATYVQPHRHRNKSESFHVVDGTLDVVIFTEAGDIEDVIEMGPFGGGRHFYYRLADAAYHTVVPRSDQAVIHETTNGPFDPAESEFAAWAPSETAGDDGAACYVSELQRRIDDFVARRRAA